MVDRRQLEIKAKLFRGFADPSRLAILEVLRSAPATVGEIAASTGQGLSNVSNHLRCLRDCGLVVRQRDGQRVRYSLSDQRVAALLELAERVLAESATGVASCPRYDRVEEHPKVGDGRVGALR
jgi:DNA-binding transcriptional ArsR family regulator